jgi:hypothetical protein
MAVSMRMRRALALFLLLVAVFAMFAPSGAAHAHDAVLIALGLVVPTIHITVVRLVATRSEAQPVALLSLHAFRAPPSFSAFA